jgi:hypothetical protein
MSLEECAERHVCGIHMEAPILVSASDEAAPTLVPWSKLKTQNFLRQNLTMVNIPF